MKKIVGIIVMATLSMGLLTGCGQRPEINTDPVVIEETAIPVKIGKALKSDLVKSVYTVGEVAPSKSYTVNSKNNGDVLKVNFSLGDEVVKGDVLFTIDTYDFQVDKNSKLYQLTNSLTQSKTTMNDAAETYAEKQSLFDAGAISQAELDGAKTQLDNSKIAYNNTLDSYRSTKKTYDSRAKDYEVTSPIDGIITGSSIEEGMFATTQNGFTIVVADSLKVNANVASKYINDIEKNQAAVVEIKTLEKVLKGTVKSVNLNSNNGAYPVEIIINDGDGQVLPGMYADVKIATETLKDALTVPAKIVITENNHSYLYKLVADNRVEKIEIEVGITVDGMTEIKGMITDQDDIVVLGQTYLEDGQLVNVVE